MRYFLFILLALASCKNKQSKDTLLGSWTIVQDETKYPKSDIGISDRLTFYPNDSFKIELKWEGHYKESFAGTYMVNIDSALLVMKGGGMEKRHTIHNLSPTKLSLVTGKTIHYYKRP